ncbi:hypothetical protein [Pareuzebyella sediminis]|uniref:hypothetical protein n=1 Tax=Pareuzebyella sediminis TaxID=2607998 RepID=UPI0011ED4FA8|nr:hypothetical protein [Pareuzebyella sediminis]
MNNKKELIEFLNTNRNVGLNSSNTSYSKINVSKEVWWLNIKPHKFRDDVNLLLRTEGKVIWVYLPKGFVKDIHAHFRLRQDKGVIDLEISADKKYMYLRDVKSGGTGFDFSKFVKDEIVY